jgi:hypothetical protein
VPGLRLTDDLALAADADLVPFPSACCVVRCRQIKNGAQVFIAVRSNEYTQVQQWRETVRDCCCSLNVRLQVLSALHGHIKPSCMVVSLVSGQVTCDV